MRRYPSLLNEFQTRFSARPPFLLERAGLWAWLGAALEHHKPPAQLRLGGRVRGASHRDLESLNSRQGAPFAVRRDMCAGTECRRTPGMHVRYLLVRTVLVTFIVEGLLLKGSGCSAARPRSLLLDRYPLIIPRVSHLV